MVIYRVIHNLTANTIEDLLGHCNVSRYAECFATKSEATKYANQIKKGLLSYTKEKKQEYKDSGSFSKEQGEYGVSVLDYSPTEYIKGCGFRITVIKVSIKGKAELAQALSSIPLQEFHQYSGDCNPTDHLECAVFQWDADNATNRTVYGRSDTFDV